eukprot:gene11571-13504_t
MDDQYKKEHELFVQNLSGSTLIETFIRFVLEFATIVLPFIVSVTFTEMAPFMLVLLLISCAVMPIFAKRSTKLFYFDENKEMIKDLNSPKKRFIEEYRAFVMLGTVICILAVDFPVFPRRFSKTETFGKPKSDQDKKSSSATPSSPKMSRVALAYHALLSNLPLLVLGFARLALTKSTNYQEHVTEYGIHWNFFFTLAFVTIILSFIKLSPNANLVVGISLICGYQVILSKFGLAEYILEAPRVSLISANKEGIASLAGYLSIYLIGTKLGTTIFNGNRTTVGQWRRYALTLMGTALVLYSLLYFVEEHIQPISRRMTNLGYVLAILTLNIFNFGVNLLVSLITASHLYPSAITEGINRNQLFIFLLANVCTGIVNLSMKTIYATPETSIGVIGTYTLFLCTVGVVMNRMNITLKLT